MPDLSVAENLYLGALPRHRLGAVAWRRMIGTTEELITSVGLRADPRSRTSPLRASRRRSCPDMPPQVKTMSDPGARDNK